jgi:EpsI family protein
VNKSTKEVDWIGAPLLLLLVLQILIAHVLVGNERPPRPPDLENLPPKFGPWTLFRKDPIDPAIAKDLGADRLVSQDFREIPGGSSASLLVAWFRTQSEGARQPHSPKVCLPGAGWTPQLVDEVTLETRQGQIRVNRYVVNKATERAVVLYWYQTPRRVIAGEWAAKFWLAADALRDRRTDTSLVRVVVDATENGDEKATQAATRFVRDFYPILRAQLN